jgi:membrane associated rhomboid family serine protease
VIPLQDVVPSRQTPVATIAVLVATVLYFVALGTGPSEWRLAAPVAHRSVATLAVGLLLLWLFGDNVEARLGRVTLCVIYVIAGWLPGLGASGGVTAIIASHVVLLPRSRVLTLVPFPPVLAEVPALYFLAVWAVVHVPLFVGQPRRLWAFGLAFLFGAAIARVMRRPVAW